MSREIKFRAWGKQEERIIYNVQNESDGRIDSQDCFEDYLDGEYFEIMQYTGLKDKNGKEIYEGDILALIEPEVKGKQSGFGKMVVKFGDYDTYELETGDESIGWFVEGYHGYLRENGKRDVYETKSLEEHPWGLLQCKNWEVIGNVYENPELLRT